MKKLSILMLSALALGACSSSPEEPEYEIQSQTFYDKVDDNGRKLFAYVVSVKAQRAMKLDLSQRPSRSEVRRFAEQELFEDSRALKLQLEDEAASALKKELEQRQYCDDEYKIDEVLWRDFSVQLRGYCL